VDRVLANFDTGREYDEKSPAVVFMDLGEISLYGYYERLDRS
jgi:hypothetical protein